VQRRENLLLRHFPPELARCSLEVSAGSWAEGKCIVSSPRSRRVLAFANSFVSTCAALPELTQSPPTLETKLLQEWTCSESQWIVLIRQSFSKRMLRLFSPSLIVLFHIYLHASLHHSCRVSLAVRDNYGLHVD